MKKVIFKPIYLKLSIPLVILTTIIYAVKLLVIPAINEHRHINLIKGEISQRLEGDYHPTRIMVKYKEGVGEEEILEKSKQRTGKKQRFYKPKHGPIVQTVHIKNSPKLDKEIGKNESKLNALREEYKDELSELMLEYKLDPDVESVDVVHRGELFWNDTGTRTYSDDFDNVPSYATGSHWYYYKVKLPELWDDQSCATAGPACGGDSSITVAVIDSGIAYEDYTATYEWYGENYSNIVYADAPELTGINLYTNSSDPYGSGDQDSNGICDDYHGVDMEMWVENWDSGDPGTCSGTTDIQKEGHANDDYGHGTYVTGIIASLTNNATKSAAISHNVEIMPIKVNIPFSGWIWEDSFYYGVQYAVDNGADVINVSLGWCNDSSGYLKAAVNYAESAGVVMAVAAGNSTCGWSTPLCYPAQYNDSNVIAVGATNSDNSRSSYSQYGSSLDVVAPVGEGSGEYDATWQETLNCAWSCDEDDNFTLFKMDYSSGTSFATPQVAAGAALIKFKNPAAKHKDIRDVLFYNTTSIGGSGTGRGLLNLEEIWNANYFLTAAIWDPDFGDSGDEWFVGDFNNDSRDDIALVRPVSPTVQRWYVNLSNGSSFSSTSIWDGDFGDEGDKWFVGDFNGDSRDDITLVRSISYPIQRLYVNLSDGSSFGSTSVWDNDFGSEDDQWFVGDFNGDSRDDIALVRSVSSSKQRWYVNLSDGSSFSSTSIWDNDFGDEGDKWFVGDFNNDSRDDIALVRSVSSSIQRWYVNLSDGSSFSSTSVWDPDFGSSTDQWFVGDFNGDNLDDISLVRDVSSTTKTWYVNLSDGSDFSDTSIWDSDFGDSGDIWFAGKFNNDSKTDLSLTRSINPLTQKWYVLPANTN